MFDTIWHLDCQPQVWQKSLIRPFSRAVSRTHQIRLRTAAYTCSALAKLFEGFLVTRLTAYTETHNTLTDNQFGSRPGRQTHDAIYSLISIIQYNRLCQKKPTHVAFIDYTTAYPSVFRQGLCHELYNQGIRGKMWRHLRERFHEISVRVLHPSIPSSNFVQVKRGLPEGSRLSHILFGIVAADLIRESRQEFPQASVHSASFPGGPQSGGPASPSSIWIGGIFYVDDLCLCSTHPSELQAMINFTKRWSERSRLQINAEKTKIMAFHETPTQEASRLINVPQFYLHYAFSTLSRKVLKVVDQFEYLGFCLDSKPLMHRAR